MIENKTDHELMDEIKKGSVECFNVLHRRYARVIFQFVYHMVGRRENAKDITQEVFLKVYEKAGRYESTGKLSGWIFQIARNTTLNYIRNNRSAQRAVSIEAVEEAPEAHTEIRRALHDDNARPDEVLLSNEGKEILKNGMDKLKPKEREMIILCDIERLPHQEVSEILGTTVGSLNVMLHRARMNLANAIGVKYNA